MDLLALAAALAVMGAIIAFFLALYKTTAHPGMNLERRLGNVLGETTGFELSAPSMEALRPQKEDKLPLFGSVLAANSWTEGIASQLESAEIRLTVSEFIALRVLVAVFLAAVPLLLLHGFVGVLLALAAAFVGWLLPNVYVGMATGKRRNRIEVQLPEMLSMVSNSLKAGFGLMQALDLASRELPEPVSLELRRMIQDVSVGAARDVALQNMARRCDSPDLDIVVTAMVVQQSTGGNLAEILDNVGHTMRERTRIRGEIKTLTAQQLMTGFIIGALPLVMLGAFSVMSPDYMAPLIKETAGNIMLIVGALLELFGIMLIKKIMAIEV